MGYSLDDIRAAIELALQALVHQQAPEDLYSPIWYTLQSGGKRIRPSLCISVADWLSEAPIALQDVMPVAIAIEIFHNFTLLHDDVMDVSALRRGRTTVWKRWNVNTAILSGDAMNILAYEQLAKAPQAQLPELLKCFNDGAMRVCMGQQWDMEFEQSPLVTEQQYLEMIAHKTSALLEMSVRLGFLLAPSKYRDIEESLIQFAREIGLAFQLQDDYLDVYGDSNEFGKECGDDIVTNKQTYLSVLLQTRASANQLEQFNTYKELGSLQRADKIRKVMALYDELRICSVCETAIKTHLDAAERHLAQCEKTIGRVSPALRAIFMSLRGRRF